MRWIAASFLGLLAWVPAGGPPAQAATREAAAPRTAVTIGEFSVVLIAADGQIHAFVDRLADNAPAGDVALRLAPRGGAGLALTQPAPGLFVAPFAHAGHVRDSLVVSLATAGAREAPDSAVAELVYQAGIAPPPPEPAGLPVGPLLWLLGLAAAAVALGLGWRGGWKWGGWRPLFGKQAA